MIRKYREEDMEEIVEVWFKASLIAHPFLDAAFTEKEKGNIREIYLPNADTWVYEIQKKVIGFIAMIENEVGAIFITPDFHGQGIGTQLMNYVAQMHNVLEVEVFKENVIGRAFYDKYGFIVIKEHLHHETSNMLLRMKYQP